MEKLQHLFPEAKTIADITWSHAVNSREKAINIVNNPEYNFIEFDILTSKTGEVITAHPPADESNQTLEQLLKLIKQTDSVQGIKMDFKDPSVVDKSLTLIKEIGISNALILNADVLTGNNARISKFDPNQFIKECRGIYPDAILSLGWTTTPNDPYTQGVVNEMLSLCEMLSNDITFPVRACLIPASWGVLLPLLGSPKHSFTIWNNEPLTPELTQWLRNIPDPTRCFYDLIESSGDPIRIF